MRDLRDDGNVVKKTHKQKTKNNIQCGSPSNSIVSHFHVSLHLSLYLVCFSYLEILQKDAGQQVCALSHLFCVRLKDKHKSCVRKRQKMKSIFAKGVAQCVRIHTHTHTQICIYIFLGIIAVCVCAAFRQGVHARYNEPISKSSLKTFQQN